MINYEVVKWKLSNIRQFYDEKKLILPMYQRGVKWDETRKKNLIETMRHGNPIGTFLVYRDQDNDQFQIVDGLQRISTIISYTNLPEKYIDNEILDNDIVEELVRLECEARSIKFDPVILESYVLDKRKEIVKIFKELKDDREDFNIEVFRQMKIDVEKYDMFSPIIKRIKIQIVNRFNLAEIEIPVIIYSGEKRDLPRIFTDINKNSLILTEYEIYAAQWADINIGEIDDSLFDKLKNKYEKINSDSDNGFDIDYDRDLDNDKTMNLYEYCFSISEIITEPSADLSHILSSRKNAGFEIISTLLTNQYNFVETLEYVLGNDKLGYRNQNKNLLKELYKAIRETLRDLKFIDEYVMIKTKNYMYSDYQAFHIFISLFRKKFVITHKIRLSNGEDRESKDFSDIYNLTKYSTKKSLLSITNIETKIEHINNYKSEYKKFKLYVLPVIIKQTFEDFWTSNRQINDLVKQIKQHSDIYFEDISENDFKDTIRYSLVKQSEDTDYYGKSFPRDVKLVAVIVHNILLKTSLKYKDECGEYKNYDFDHLVPKTILKDLSTKSPISSLMNCWVLDKKSNIRKRGLPISELASTPFTKLDKEFLEIINITEEQYDLIKEIKDLSVAAKKANFEKFVNLRIEELTNSICNLKRNYIKYIDKSNQ